MIPRSAEMAGGEQNRTLVSPLGKSMEGLCPTLIVCSEHEATTDEDFALFNKMKKAGCNVEMQSMKYMCHVWCLVPLIPEAGIAMGRIQDWMQRKVWA